MAIIQDRFEASLKRSLAELSSAVLKLRALDGLRSAHSVHALDFFRLAGTALFNDVLGHAMRVFDEHKQAAAFWYVVKVNEPNALNLAKELEVNFEALKLFSANIKIIRDRTHFHIDKDAVKNSALVWENADVNGNQLRVALDSAFSLLSEIYFRLSGIRISIPEYDGTDVPKIIKSYKEIHPDSQILIR